MTRPPIGYATKGTLTRCIDGDTVEVLVTKTIRVRLNDCNCPEVRTIDLEEKELGFAAKEYAEQLALGNEVTLFVPAGRMSDLLTLDRVLGQIWVGDDERTLGERLIEAGHGKA